MSRGGHNWKGGDTVEGTLCLDVMKLARAGFLSSVLYGGWQWTRRDDTTSSINITGGRQRILLSYRHRAYSDEWVPVEQTVPIWWTACRFGGERPWFVCDVRANGVYCGRRVAKLYMGGRLFACRHCYRLGYAVQRINPMDQAHHQLARLHRKLGADYDGPEMPPTPKPKWMRWKTYNRIVRQIEDGEERLDTAFVIGTRYLLARLEKIEEKGRK